MPIDRGITYIDTGESYQTHPWVREAIKGLPREKLYIQSKMLHMGGFGGRGGFGGGGGFGNEVPALERLDRFRKELNVDYIDTVLIHCQIDPNWEEHSKSLMDGLEEAKQKKIIRAHGVSCHSLPALKKAAGLRLGGRQPRAHQSPGSRTSTHQNCLSSRRATNRMCPRS